MPAQDLFTNITGFEFKELLGGGGFGAVRRAVDKLGRDVAIKVLTLDEEDERETSNRQFLREAATLANLNHPSIVTLYSFDIDSIGQPYMVMEFVQGTPLNKMIKADKLHLVEKLFIVLQTAKALQYAHSFRPHPVVHRDIKPHNLIVRADTTVKLIDFGIALGKRGITATKDLREASMTVAGSFPYMSPEHWNPPVSPWGDVFSLGVVLFELLTGMAPFANDRDPLPAAYQKIISPAPAPPLSDFGMFPPGLEEVVAKVLGKQRSNSFDDAQQFALALSRIYNRLRPRFFSERLLAARDAAQAGDFDKAQDIVAQVLAMDPGNDEAADVQASLSQARLQIERTSQVQAICNGIEESLLNKKFDDAQRGLDQALEIDPENPNLTGAQFRLQQARELHQRITSLVARAEEQQKSGHLQTAGRLLDEALSLDRSSTLALNRRAALERIRAREHELCQQARGALDQSAFPQAFELIEQAEALAPESERVKAIRELAERLLQESKDRQEIERIQCELETGIAAGGLEAAREQAERAVARFPAERRFRDLRNRLEMQLGRDKREENVQQECAAAEQELAAGNAAAALGRVRQALIKFPGNEQLLQLADRATREAEVQEKSRRRGEILAKAAKSLEQKDPAAATITLEMGLAEFSHDSEFRQLLKNATQALEESILKPQASPGQGSPASSPDRSFQHSPRRQTFQRISGPEASPSVPPSPETMMSRSASYPQALAQSTLSPPTIAGEEESAGRRKWYLAYIALGVLGIVGVVLFLKLAISLRNSGAPAVPTELSMTVSPPSPVAVGAEILVTAQITAQNAMAAHEVSGRVKFSEGSMELGSAEVRGNTASVKLPPFPPGSHHTISAAYSGDSIRQGSSATLEVAVRPPPATEKQANAALREGDIFLKRGDFAGAIEAYKRGLGADPGNNQLNQRIVKAERAQQEESEMGIDSGAAHHR